MDTLRVGHLSTLYHTSIVIQAMPEMMEDLSLSMRWRLFGTGPAIVEAFQRNEIDLAYIGLPPAVIGISRGVDIICVAGGHVEGTVISSHGKAVGYPETDDLPYILSQFKRIGVPGKGSIHDIIIADLINTHGVKAEILNMAWADEVLEAFIHGHVDAVVGTPALAEAVIYYGGGRIVYPPHRLWSDNPSYGILVRRRLLKEYRDHIKEFLLLHERASWLIRNKPVDVAASVADLLRLVDKKFVLETIRISPHYCADITDGYINCTMKLTERMKSLGYIEGEFKETDIFDLEIIREIHPEPAHYRDAIKI
ncbi:MAG: ABC transporter substrate-binding protein [Nitrospirae bacterium]|nr:ABC transporter substrate-binding protein [Nitrospirota bacterium]